MTVLHRVNMKEVLQCDAGLLRSSVWRFGSINETGKYSTAKTVQLTFEHD